jgi:hypothetical protein
MADEFAHLHGRRLVPLIREASPGYEWEFVDVEADGSFTLERAMEGITGSRNVPPELRSPPVLVPLFAAINDNRLGLMATGSHKLGFTRRLEVPPGLIEGRCRVYNVEDYLVALDPRGREVGPRYDRPVLAAPGSGGWLPSPSSWPRLIMAALTGGLSWGRAPARGRGRPPIDDTEDIALVRAEIAARELPIREATAAVADRLVKSGVLTEASRQAWEERIRKKV